MVNNRILTDKNGCAFIARINVGDNNLSAPYAGAGPRYLQTGRWRMSKDHGPSNLRRAAHELIEAIESSRLSGVATTRSSESPRECIRRRARAAFPYTRHGGCSAPYRGVSQR